MKSQAKPALYRRQKVLLALLDAFGGRLPSVDFQKYLFLFTQECEAAPSYEFIPYRYGCFSFQSYADRRKLVELGYLAEGSDWRLTSTEDVHVDTDQAEEIKGFARRHRSKAGNALVRFVYRQYPYYAVNSTIARDLMNSDELSRIDAERPVDNSPTLFTIGYEGGSFENYLNRLIRNNVQVLCDVRKNPLSRKYGFSRSTLAETLEKIGIRYVHMPTLGIQSDKRRELNTREDYEALFHEYEHTTLTENERALAHITDLIRTHRRVALTCFEADACMCHRGRVATSLASRPDWHYDVVHI